MDLRYENELKHYGVKGMKWGVRRRGTNKWATAKHQPSSFKSSVLAGAYAATGNKKIGKALDKSNDRDAERWEREKTKAKSIDKQIANGKKKANSIVKSEEKTLVKDMIKNYDMSDENAEEALAILREIERDLDR